MGGARDGRLAKDEFDLRVGQALASRTYADLNAVTAVIPDGLTDARPPAGRTREPGRRLSFKTAARVGAVGAPEHGFCCGRAGADQRSARGGRRAARGLTGLFVAGALATLLMLLSWAVRRSQSRPVQEPSGPAGIAPKRQAASRQLPPAKHHPWRIAEAARSRLPRAASRAVALDPC